MAKQGVREKPVKHTPQAKGALSLIKTKTNKARPTNESGLDDEFHTLET
jgi:hypothetical protein